LKSFLKKNSILEFQNQKLYHICQNVNPEVKKKVIDELKKAKGYPRRTYNELFGDNG
jgi:soluble P-type ATPase